MSAATSARRSSTSPRICAAAAGGVPRRDRRGRHRRAVRRHDRAQRDRRQRARADPGDARAARGRAAGRSRSRRPSCGDDSAARLGRRVRAGLAVGRERRDRRRAASTSTGAPVVAISAQGDSPLAQAARRVAAARAAARHARWRRCPTPPRCRRWGCCATRCSARPPRSVWDRLPELAAGVIERADRDRRARSRERFAAVRALDAVGGGPAHASAGETALLAREALRLPATGMETREYLHGPLEAVAPGVRLRSCSAATASARWPRSWRRSARPSRCSPTPRRRRRGRRTVIELPRGPAAGRADPADPPRAAARRAHGAGCGDSRSASCAASSTTPRWPDGRRWGTGPAIAVTVIGCVQADVLMSPVSELPAAGGDAADRRDEHPRRAAPAPTRHWRSPRPGMPVRLMGCIGDDQLGRWMCEELEPCGLADELVVLDRRAQRADRRARVAGARPHVPHLPGRQQAAGSRR